MTCTASSIADEYLFTVRSTGNVVSSVVTVATFSGIGRAIILKLSDSDNWELQIRAGLVDFITFLILLSGEYESILDPPEYYTPKQMTEYRGSSWTDSVMQCALFQEVEKFQWIPLDKFSSSLPSKLELVSVDDLDDCACPIHDAAEEFWRQWQISKTAEQGWRVFRCVAVGLSAKGFVPRSRVGSVRSNDELLVVELFPPQLVEQSTLPWIMRSGVAFGFHLLMYQRDPSLVHSSYAVYIMSTQREVPGETQDDWARILRNTRIAQNVKKDQLYAIFTNKSDNAASSSCITYTTNKIERLLPTLENQLFRIVEFQLLPKHS